MKNAHQSIVSDKNCHFFNNIRQILLLPPSLLYLIIITDIILKEGFHKARRDFYMKEKGIGCNSHYLLRDGAPWLPVMGEMQYARTKREDWREGLLKMKAGGVEIVQFYISWIHHEEIENEWDFSGNKSLRAFLTEIKDCGLYAMLRIGPWIHGEVRNGGFPDWLLKKGWQLRSNDEKYLEKVREYFGKLYSEAEGYFYSEGGPIIGVQVENEYGHCISENSGPATDEHLLVLKKMLKDMGFDAPLYTVTAWGGACTADMIPVWGGYCYHPWEFGSEKLPPNHNYVFKDSRNDANIGAELKANRESRDTVAGYPYFTAELGGGIHCTENRRPRVRGIDIGAMSLCKLGSGMNMFGYYVYHGGMNPVGKLSYMNEFRAQTPYSGCASDVLKLSYDFQAPIDEFGNFREAYKEIKLLGLAMPDFGGDIAPLNTCLGLGTPAKADDLTSLRYAFRKDCKHGYLFVNNYQREYVLPRHENVVFKAELDGECVTFPSVDIENGEYFFWPFNMKIGKSLLKYATASPLCILNENTYVFYSAKTAKFEFEGELDPAMEIICLSRAQALDAYKITLDKQYLFISDSVVIQDDKSVFLIGEGDAEFKVYPELKAAPEGFIKAGNDGKFTCYKKVLTSTESKVSFEKISAGKYRISIEYGEPSYDVVLKLNYRGSKVHMYIGDSFIADNYYNGAGWSFSTRYFGFPSELIMEIEALGEDADVYLEEPIEYKDGVADMLDSIEVIPKYKTSVL